MADTPHPSSISTDREDTITLPTDHNETLQKVLEAVNNHTELKTIWRMQNVNAVDRLGFHDHGHVHAQIVSNIALKIGRMLFDSGVTPSLLDDFDGFTMDDAEVVIVLAAMLHDTGISISRKGHEEFSLLVSQPLLDDILDDFYSEEARVILRSEILHAIISHRAGGNPMTVEAGIVRVADALDMEKGRSRASIETGTIDIHSVSAAAVDRVELEEGEDRPIAIDIKLNNSAGIFQIDELLKNKIEGSGLEDYISVEALVKGESEKRILHNFTL